MSHATAPRSACTLAQARPTMSCIHLVDISLTLSTFPTKRMGEADSFLLLVAYYNLTT